MSFLGDTIQLRTEGSPAMPPLGQSPFFWLELHLSLTSRGLPGSWQAPHSPVGNEAQHAFLLPSFLFYLWPTCCMVDWLSSPPSSAGMNAP